MLENFRVWEYLNYFQSAEVSQRYLKNCYKKLLNENVEVKSYENCYPFMYFLEHGEIYYKQALNAPMAIKPVLLFYGLVHLLKACLLTVDPFYPETTSVLAHGVSSRKRKKQQYQFMNDEVKVQKLGLCTHFASKMFHVEQLEGEKFLMIDLFLEIPELDDCFIFNRSTNIIPISKNENKYKVPVTILDQYHMTFESFQRFLEQKGKIEITSMVQNGGNILFSTNCQPNLSPPFRLHLTKDMHSLPAKQSKFMYMPDLIIHYLLSYNLSMIARYETEWWCELLKSTPTNDYPFIKTFLSIMSHKTPYLALQFLNYKGSFLKL